MPETTQIDAAALRSVLNGAVHVPGDPEWDQARQAWNLAVDQHPEAVAMAVSPDDVVATVNFAREHGLRVAPQGTGHSAAPVGSLEGAILLKTSQMRGVVIDSDARTARVEAGVIWTEVSEPASKLGLAPLAGSSRDVGVVGYTLGGGLSWLARRHGLAANSVIAADVVTGDGRLVRADHDSEPELFWALRGGSGNFGVVTALEFALFPAPEVYAGMLAWPLDQATTVLNRWVEWAGTAPDEVSTSARLFRVPPLPDIPDLFRGRDLVAIDGAYLGAEADGRELLEPLRELGPEIDGFAMISPEFLGDIHMDPPEPVPAIGDHAMVGELDAAAVEAMVDVAGPGVDSPLLMVELRQLGGALSRPAPGRGALDVLDGDAALFGVGMVMGPEAAGAIVDALGALKRAMEPWDTGGAYLNFCEQPTDTRKMFPPETHGRLESVKGQYDPQGIFQANHGIAVAA